jgi:hypothetical protein
MDDFDPAELARIRYRGRPDWRRFIRPNWARGPTPAQIEAQQKEFAKWDRAFETPMTRRLRLEQEEREQIERARLDAEIERDVLAMKAEFASVRAEFEQAELRWKAECAERKRKAGLAWERFIAAWKRGDFRRKANFNPDQPRDELGRWTDEGDEGTESDRNDVSLDAGDSPQDSESLAQDRQSFVAPGPGQEPRRDLVDLDAIANHPTIRARIDEGWTASDPNGFGREQGFWISRNDATGELFTRPFANPGSALSIVPGAPPSDAIAFFHTHPARPDFGGDPSPSRYDQYFAIHTGLPGLLQSHSGMYYFGPLLRPRRSP